MSRRPVFVIAAFATCVAFLATCVAAFATLIGVVLPAAAVAGASPGATVYVYVLPDNDRRATYTAAERGPPLTHGILTTDNVADRLPHGSAGRLNTATPSTSGVYDHPAALFQVGVAATPESAAGIATPRTPAPFARGGAAAKSADEFVDLASAQRRTHILTGDATGGGHLWPGLPGKTPFPKSWSGDRIMHEISDIATDPAAWANVQNQGQRAVLYGTRGGVEIKVVVNRGTGDIITGHPINLPRNPG